MRRKAYILSSNEMARPALLWWLEDHGFDRHRDITFVHERRDIATAKSAAMIQALKDGVDMAVFCENDALPSARETDGFFLENRYHLQCVKYATESVHAFPRFDSFHTLIWRASAQSLRKLADAARSTGRPLCWEERSETGAEITACSCASIAVLAKQAGLSTGWIGSAGHLPKSGSLVPRVATYGA